MRQPSSKSKWKYASTERIDRHHRFATGFFSKIYNLKLGEMFVSDKSTLHDFPLGQAEVLQKVKKGYRVDITQVKDKPIWEIFEYILARRS